MALYGIYGSFVKFTTTHHNGDQLFSLPFKCELACIAVYALKKTTQGRNIGFLIKLLHHGYECAYIFCLPSYGVP